MADGQSTITPIDEDHILDIGIAIGLSAAIGLLESQSEGFERLPGYRTAQAVVQTMEADHRAQLAGKNIRAAAREGFDIQTHSVGLRGRGEIFVSPIDEEGPADAHD